MFDRAPARSRAAAASRRGRAGTPAAATSSLRKRKVRAVTGRDDPREQRAWVGMAKRDAPACAPWVPIVARARALPMLGIPECHPDSPRPRYDQRRSASPSSSTTCANACSAAAAGVSGMLRSARLSNDAHDARDLLCFLDCDRGGPPASFAALLAAISVTVRLPTPGSIGSVQPVLPVSKFAPAEGPGLTIVRFEPGLRVLEIFPVYMYAGLIVNGLMQPLEWA